MCLLPSQRIFALLLVGALSFTQLPTDAVAGWKKNENLPGFVSGKSLLLVGVGTAGAIFLIAKLSKAEEVSKTKARQSESPKKSTPNPSNRSLFAENSHRRTAPEPRVAPFLSVNDYGMKNIDSWQQSIDFKNKTVSLGLFASL